MQITKKKVSHNWNHEEIWNEYGKMIMQIAHKFKKNYNHTFDELVSEGITHVLEKLHKWNPSKGALSTYIRTTAYYAMLELCYHDTRMKLKNQLQIPTDIHNDKKTRGYLEKEYKPNNWFQNLLSELSEEAKTLVKIVIEAPEELYEVIGITRPVRSKQALKRYMIDVHDWTTREVKETFKEVKSCL